MSGFQTYQRYQRIEDQAKKLGFRIGNPRVNWSDKEAMDMVTLYPGEDDALPIFGRDADIFTGTFSQVEIFLTGWARSQQYDRMVGLSTDKKRIKKEHEWRHKMLLDKLKHAADTKETVK